MSNEIEPYNAGSELETFGFDGDKVRVVVRDGEPWFVLADACKILGISNPSDAANGIEEDALGTTEVIDSMGRLQRVRAVDESGLYELIFKSRKPEARVFKRWVMREVLPQIRKTGAYRLDSISRLELAQMVVDAEEEKKALEAELNRVKPKAESQEKWEASSTTYSSNEVAKMLSVRGIEIGGRNKLYRFLDLPRQQGGLGWFFKDSSGTRLPYQQYVDAGYVTVRPGFYERKDGSAVATSTPRFTPRGVEVIATHFESQRLLESAIPQ